VVSEKVAKKEDRLNRVVAVMDSAENNYKRVYNFLLLQGNEILKRDQAKFRLHSQQR
jgi:hypothetical protein